MPIITGEEGVRQMELSGVLKIFLSPEALTDAAKGVHFFVSRRESSLRLR